MLSSKFAAPDSRLRHAIVKHACRWVTVVPLTWRTHSQRRGGAAALVRSAHLRLIVVDSPSSPTQGRRKNQQRNCNPGHAGTNDQRTGKVRKTDRMVSCGKADSAKETVCPSHLCGTSVHFRCPGTAFLRDKPL